jgi:hypothetical protein
VTAYPSTTLFKIRVWRRGEEPAKKELPDIGAMAETEFHLSSLSSHVSVTEASSLSLPAGKPVTGSTITLSGVGGCTLSLASRREPNFSV